ncbi:MAG: ComEC/Rec2 family competence protein, partial [Planctomycetales bacterium]
MSSASDEELALNAGREAEEERTRRGGRYQPLVAVVAAFAIGILADRFSACSVLGWLAVGVGCWATWLILFRVQRKGIASLALLASVAATGGAWGNFHWSLFPKNDLGGFAGLREQPVALRAVAQGRPRLIPAKPFNPLRSMPSEQTSRLLVKATAIRDGADWKPTSGFVSLTTAGELTGIQFGDQLLIFAHLSAPKPAQNEGELDRAWHARADRRRSQLRASFPGCVTVIRPGDWSPRRMWDGVRSRSDSLLWRYLDRKRTGLAAALLLGSREQVDQDTIDAFVTTGTMHLLAISGLHVGVLAGFLFLGLRAGFLPRPLALVAVAVLVLVYAMLVDARPPVIRATALVWIVCLAMLLRRRARSFNTLAAAALVILVWNPSDLFRAGAQLSFLAVAAMIAFVPSWNAARTTDALQQLIEESRPWPLQIARQAGRWAAQAMWLSFVVWAVTAPLVAARFHLFSPGSILLNLFLWLPTAGALLSGFGVLIFGAWLPSVASVFGWCCGACLTLLETIVEFAAACPGSHFWVCGPPGWWLAVLYLGIAAWIAGLRWVIPSRWGWTAAVAWLGVSFATSLWQANPPGVTCEFLAVGHGLSTIVTTPDGRVLLCDAGRLGPPETGARIIARSLWSRGITHLDAVV